MKSLLWGFVVFVVFFFFKFYPSRSSWPRVSTREGRGRPGNTGITHLPPTQVPSLLITIMIDESNIVQSMHASITFIILVVHAESGKGKCSTLFTDSVQWLSCPSWMDGTYCGCTAVIILNWHMFEASELVCFDQQLKLGNWTFKTKPDVAIKKNGQKDWFWYKG